MTSVRSNVPLPVVVLLAPVVTAFRTFAGAVLAALEPFGSLADLAAIVVAPFVLRRPIARLFPGRIDRERTFIIFAIFAALVGVGVDVAGFFGLLHAFFPTRIGS